MRIWVKKHSQVKTSEKWIHFTAAYARVYNVDAKWFFCTAAFCKVRCLCGFPEWDILSIHWHFTGSTKTLHIFLKFHFLPSLHNFSPDMHWFWGFTFGESTHVCTHVESLLQLYHCNIIFCIRVTRQDNVIPRTCTAWAGARHGFHGVRGSAVKTNWLSLFLGNI